MTVGKFGLATRVPPNMLAHAKKSWNLTTLTGIMIWLKFLCCLMPFYESSVRFKTELKSTVVFILMETHSVLQQWDELRLLLLLLRLICMNLLRFSLHQQENYNDAVLLHAESSR